MTVLKAVKLSPGSGPAPLRIHAGPVRRFLERGHGAGEVAARNDNGHGRLRSSSLAPSVLTSLDVLAAETERSGAIRIRAIASRDGRLLWNSTVQDSRSETLAAMGAVMLEACERIASELMPDLSRRSMTDSVVVETGNGTIVMAKVDSEAILVALTRTGTDPASLHEAVNRAAKYLRHLLWEGPKRRDAPFVPSAGGGGPDVRV